MIKLLETGVYYRNMKLSILSVLAQPRITPSLESPMRPREPKILSFSSQDGPLEVKAGEHYAETITAVDFFLG